MAHHATPDYLNNLQKTLSLYVYLEHTEILLLPSPMRGTSLPFSSNLAGVRLDYQPRQPK